MIGSRDWTACERLIIAFMQHLDHRRFKQLACLFAHDGVWVRHGLELVGPEQIEMTIAERPETTRELHIASNIFVVANDEGGYRASAYVVIYRASVEDSEEPALVSGPVGAGEFNYGFRKTEEGLRISRLEARPLFKLIR